MSVLVGLALTGNSRIKAHLKSSRTHLAISLHFELITVS